MAAEDLTYQPILIKLLGNSNESDQYLIKFDKRFILIGNDFSLALDMFYKCFHVFNIEIPAKAKYIFDFLDLIYKMKSEKSSTIVLLFDNISKKSI